MLTRLAISLRVWRIPRLFVASLTCLTIWIILPGSIDVIGRSEDVSWPVTTLVPAIYASLTPTCAAQLKTTIERTSVHSLRRRRLYFVVLVLSLGAGTVWAAQLPDPWVLQRNMAALVGVGLFSGFLPTRLQFAPTTLLALVTWLLGTAAPGQPVPAWAVLLHDRESRHAFMVAALLLGTGTATFLSSHSVPPTRMRFNSSRCAAIRSALLGTTTMLVRWQRW